MNTKQTIAYCFGYNEFIFLYIKKATITVKREKKAK